ncbi:hypothetical protein IW261DRAFT_1611881 [Armillaria novae-zelandiae]|uniref:Uncharacterized protein n=1 Tax=Armillaria novae-zelandiae TaxID=153914 RepID=A0AA39NU29_9AGAR|nr:hypothetical protein IW261DRAFT_1611879 [Armillaria novae-zelandiae]KAK0471846.1 hypothetical protein IW261DRAFT_1611881 [Armillaria novae-zelandiae]
MLFLRPTVSLSKQLARDIRWEKEVTKSIEALEIEIDALQEKLATSKKRAENHEANIMDHAVKRRRTIDYGGKRRVSMRIMQNRRNAVIFLYPLVEDLQQRNEVLCLQADTIL